MHLTIYYPYVMTILLIMSVIENMTNKTGID